MSNPEVEYTIDVIFRIIWGGSQLRNYLGGVLRDRIELSIHFASQCPETLAAEGAGGCEAKASGPFSY